MKLTIKKIENSPAGTQKYLATVEGYEDAAERFTHYTRPEFGFVTLGVSSIKADRADCKDGDVLAAICKIAGMTIVDRTSDMTDRKSVV